MATISDLTLPSHAPSIAGFLTASEELLPAALYTLVPLSDVELDELCTACERDTSPAQPGVNIRLAPRPRFVCEDLRAVFDYHLQLVIENEFDPIYFLVAVEKEWKSRGVLIVALDNGDLECKVDKLYSLAPAAGLSIVNLQIGNLEWSDLKEDALSLPGQRGGNDDDNDDDNDDGNDDGNEDDKNDFRDDVNSDGDSNDCGARSDGGNDAPANVDDEPPIPKGPPLAGSYCGVYGVEGTDSEHVVFNLVPGAGEWKDRSQWPVMFQGTLSPSTDLVDQAFALHPSRCRRNKWLYEDMFFLADNLDPMENGILLCQLSSRRTQRVSFNALESLQELYFPIKIGTRPWIPRMPLTIVFHDNFDKGVPVHLLSKNGGECFTPGNYNANLRKRLPFDKIEEALRWFPVYCRRLRFRSNLQKNHFICIPKDWEKGVMLIEVKWDSDLSRSDDELKALNLSVGMKSLRVPIEEAYTTLRDIVEGKKLLQLK